MNAFYIGLDAIRRWSGYRLPRTGPLGWRLYNRYCKGVVRSHFLPGILADIDLSQRVPRQIYWRGINDEPKMAKLMKQHIRGDAIFFDIGANFGLFSLWTLSQCPGARVHAFEPNSTCHKFLEDTRALNRLEDRLSIHRIGLADENTRAVFTADIDNPGNSTFASGHPAHGVEATRTEMMELRRFDDWRADAKLEKKGLWICKIDTEGFECRVLRGMQKTLEQQLIDVLFIEAFPAALRCAGSTARELIEYISGFGYSVRDVDTMEAIRDVDPDDNRNLICRKGGA